MVLILAAMFDGGKTSDLNAPKIIRPVLRDGWCRNYLRTKGDADGNGKVDNIDYFYYVAIKSGAKVPAIVYPDFDGNDSISIEDRAVIIRTLIIQSQQ